ncbi:DNA alkylation repair protein [Candidatus Gracilibacteria bacterium HOT-871]|nr:DNA alkylation repair protein [Candidatus Gracilibacteria bacterium HOT-871]
MDFEKIFSEMKQIGVKDNVIPMEKYMRNKFRFLGIKTPERRKLAKKLFKNIDKNTEIDWDFVFKCWENDFREMQYLALDYIKILQKTLLLKDITNLKKLIVSKSWWDTIDNIDLIIGQMALEFEEIDEILLEWSISENIWLRRIAIDHQLLRKENTKTEVLEKILTNNFGSDEFFINKAIGWALRDFSKTNPVWVKNFLEKYSSKMSSLSIKEASKYL